MVLSLVSSYLADIDARVLLIISPVTERQAEFLLAVLSAQFHLLLSHTHTHAHTRFYTNSKGQHTNQHVVEQVMSESRITQQDPSAVAQTL